MPGREETWQQGKIRRRKSFGSSMLTVVSMFTFTPHVDRQLESGDAFLEPNWNALQNPGNVVCLEQKESLS